MRFWWSWVMNLSREEFDYILKNGESYLVEFKETVNKSLSREMTGTARRREVYELPLDAIREAVINAVVHRDYLLSGSHVVIEVFDDRLEISNPGGLPRGLDEKDFGKKEVRRNQLIASLLHRIDFVENMGTGIGKIKQLLKQADAPQPRFEFGNFFTIIFPRPEKDKDGNEGEKLGEKLGKKLGENDLKVLNILKHDAKASIVFIAKETGLSTTGIEKIISRLKDKNLLRRIGPAKGGRWELVEDD